ncbi:NEAT domain-containing protein [Sporosarcina sp. FA9]|uniref:NEAT domain-containing protein n=1 Tax=Sporosarcina sp. FA9 TaxID=3413030 RepID=UPI003F6603BA
MKRHFALLFSFFMILFMSTNLNMSSVLAEEFSDGTYLIDYNILQVENDSVSIANDYFEKPATLTVENGEHYLQITVNHSKWVKALMAEHDDSFVDVHLVSEDATNDKRVIAIKVGSDLSEPLALQMHVQIEEMSPVYDHKYSVRLAFDVDSMEVAEVPSHVFDTSVLKSGTDDKEVQGNSTKNKSLLFVFVGVAFIAILFFIRKVKFTKK